MSATTSTSSKGEQEEEQPTTTSCLVLEFMEHDLRSVPSEMFRGNDELPKVVARSVLSALQVLSEKFKAIHTGECTLYSTLLSLVCFHTPT